MPQVEWDETDIIGFLEVIPEVEEYEVSHSFLLKREGISISIQVWQLESVVEITLLNDDGSILMQYALFIHGEIEWVKGDDEHLLFKNCYFAPRRFSYMLDQALIKGNDQGRKLNVTLRIKPSINIKLIEMGDV